MEKVVGQIDTVTRVLACLPMSKEKLRLQLVNKTWRSAMESRAAHSCKTEDCDLPFAGIGVSEKVTRNLVQYSLDLSLSYHGTDHGTEAEDMFRWYKARYEEGQRFLTMTSTRDWLGPGLQELKIWFGFEADCMLQHLENLPVIDSLRSFVMKTNSRFISEFALHGWQKKFPNLKKLEWVSGEGDEFPSKLEGLTELERCEFDIFNEHGENFGRWSVGALPVGCEIIWNTIWDPDSPPLSCPAGLVSQITSLCIRGPYEQAGTVLLDFRGPTWDSLSQAISLTNTQVCYRINQLVLRNVCALPRSCNRLELKCVDVGLQLSDLMDSKFVCSEHVGHEWVLSRT